MFEKKNIEVVETENTELVEQEEKVTMGTKIKNFGKKALEVGKKAAPWVLGAAGGVVATIAAFKLSGNGSDDDEYEDDEYDDDYSDDGSEE